MMTAEPIPTTASSQDSVIAFDNILHLYLSSKSTVMAELDKLLVMDPEMPMAHLFRAYLLKLASDPRLRQVSGACLKAAQQLPMNAREQLHSAALATWFDGDSTKTLGILEQLLEQYPQDILALKIAHHLHFYSGDAVQMQRSIARAAKHYAPDHPLYGYILGMHSFGLEESGEYREAEKLGRQAVELNPDDQWAAHAVTHVMQMESRFSDGIAWTGKLLPSWQESNNFIFHIHWHQALFYLGENNLDAALGIYDTQLAAPLKDDFYLDVCNAASLLWRIEMLGGNVADRWQALRDYSARTADDELVFCTLHYLMAPARLGDDEQIKQALSDLAHWKQQDSTQAEIVREVGEPLAKAICDLGAGRYADAAASISDLSPNLHRIGGSHAQRHLFDDMQQWAAARA